MTRIGIIAGSTRPGALNPQVVAWVKAQLDEAGVENGVVNFGDYDLPVLDEEIPGGAHMYANEHTKAWGAAVEPFDGYIVVTPEYNHSAPGGLKNAIDYLFAEWNDKAAGFVSYGVHGGVRAVEHLRLTLAEVKTATVRSQVALSVYTDVDYTGVDMSDPTAAGTLAPADRHSRDLQDLTEELVSWTRALATVREQAVAVAA